MSRSALPRSTDDIRGLRVARWIRESSDDQLGRFGPASQRAEQDGAIDRFGLVDSGVEYSIAQSGKTVWQSTTMAAMLTAAGREWDILLLGYYDRWQRNLRRTMELAEDRLHPAGAALLLCDRRLLSSNPQDYREIKRLAADAEEYSDRLGERITAGYAAKFRGLDDQAGKVPLGFRRRKEKPRTMYVDTDTIGIVVTVFERYATGLVPIEQLAAEHGLGVEQVRKMLANELYIGFVRRHRDFLDADRRAAPWRSAPPISQTLGDRVQEGRARRTKGGGPRRTDRFDPLRGVLFCVCGTRVRTNGTMGTRPRTRKMHPGRCDEWGRQMNVASVVWEEPVIAQLNGIRLDDQTISEVVAALTAGGTPVVTEFDARRRARERQRLANEFAAEKLTADEFMAQLEQLPAEVPVVAPSDVIDAERAVTWLQNLARLVETATPDLLTDLLTSIYDRIEVRGAEFVSVHLTPAAMAHGLALALPDTVSVYWRPRQDLNLRPSA
jgi:hypothetical protein